MIEPWNNALLSPPPVNTFKIKSGTVIDVSHLTNTIEDFQRILQSQSPLHQEGAILSRLIYKYDKKFRSDIGYKTLKKVNTALRRYLKINLVKDIDNFSSVLPTSESNEDYLPTKQMLQYVLIRIQSFCKLMTRIIVCAKRAAVFYWDRVTRGESHWMSLMPYAVLSRIWSLCNILVKHACKAYSNLYGFLDKFKLVGVPFLPEGYSLPDDIETWLDIPNIDEHSKLEWSRNKSIQIASSMIEENIEESFDIFEYVEKLQND